MSKKEIALDISDLAFKQTGPGKDPASRLLASVRVAGVPGASPNKT